MFLRKCWYSLLTHSIRDTDLSVPTLCIRDTDSSVCTHVAVENMHRTSLNCVFHRVISSTHAQLTFPPCGKIESDQVEFFLCFFVIFVNFLSDTIVMAARIERESDGSDIEVNYSSDSDGNNENLVDFGKEMDH